MQNLNKGLEYDRIHQLQGTSLYETMYKISTQFFFFLISNWI